jgi:hypothetical protein
MQLKIEPTSELSLKLGGKKIGCLSGLMIDVSNSTSMFINVPKVQLEITINANAFDDEKKLKEVVEKASKFKFLQLTIVK